MGPAAITDPRTALSAELAAIVELDRSIRAAQAEQLRRIERARRLAADVEGVDELSTFTHREFATRAFIAELATSLTVHERTAGRMVGDAEQLTGRFTSTLHTLSDGSMCLGRVRTLLEFASQLPAETQPEFEREALEHGAGDTPSAFRRRARKLRERLHPVEAIERHEVARAERSVGLDPAPDGMAWLSIHLEAERGRAIMSRLDAFADVAGSDDEAGDPRTPMQRRTDAAADLLLGGWLHDAPAGSPLAPPTSPLGAVTPKVYVTVPVMTLLGVSDEPAELDGYGPIDADTARRLAAHAPSFQRILTHPETGAYLSYGRTTYRVPADLTGYLRVRDGSCRFPGCSRRAERCDLDHTVDWAHGGHTRHDNVAHLCRTHHRLKHRTAWRVTQDAGGELHWVSPAGREYLTGPESPFREKPPPGASEPGAADGDGDEPEPPWAAGRPADPAA
ncbi:HNH endonuclease signature motif containing protein [Agromyces sp. SYSU T00194]|uniref:HNH endonuclease signature motif containing protein n=1 Tax=Agromyces chitinivorans TaxID=3158560 RepID=UPI00339A1E4B